jgi:hypothetical protein
MYGLGLATIAMNRIVRCHLQRGRFVFKSILQRRGAFLSALMTTLLSIVVMSSASATYNSNIGGMPTSVISYEAGTVLFILDSQPTSNGACNAGYFEIDPANSSDAVVARMYARLLVAYTQQQGVQIGYDNTGACGALGYIHVYRVG